MKVSKKVKIMVGTVFVFILTAGSVTFDAIAQGPRGRCGDQTFCWDGGLYPPCIPAPTTLPVVSSVWSGGYGFKVASSNCGVKRCWWFFSCRCGPALGAGVCTAGDGYAGTSESCDRKEVKAGIGKGQS